MLFSFRYKLSILIFSVSLLILFLAYFSVSNVVEKEFRLVIEQRLLQAGDVVNQRMEDRFDRLFLQALTVADNKLTQDIISDKNLSMATRDDILRDEILPTLLLADSLLITDGDGKLLAETFVGDPFWKKLKVQSEFSRGIEGEEVAGIIFLEGKLLQWLLLPVYIGDQMFGAVILVSTLGEQELQQISQLTGTELLIPGENRYLATGWQDQKINIPGNLSVENKYSFTGLVERYRDGESLTEQTAEINLNGERYLLRLNKPANPFIPTYVVAQSLDQALAFVDSIKKVMLFIGLMSLIIAAGLGFVIAYSVSRPIQLLSRANRAVAREDFSQRVNIKTRDEFRELGESFNQMTASLSEKAKIRLALDKTSSREIADLLIKQGAMLGGETREVTILFADIKGFTSLSERLSEQQLLALLNSYFTRINSAIQPYGGTIDKYIGDAVMVLFAAPADDPLHAQKSIQAAHSICKTVLDFNAEVQSKYKCDIDVAIGINTGQVVCGLMGSEERMNYTVLGNHVNIASRVEGLSTLYGARIIVTDETRKAAIKQAGRDCSYVYRRVDFVQLKGKSVGVNLYQPIQNRDEADEKIQKYDKAYDYILKREFSAAVLEFEKYINKWPDDIVVRSWLERCQIYAGDIEIFNRDYQDGVRILTAK